MDLTDWKTAFIKLARVVTIDEVALVAASIHPLDVDSSIHLAKLGGFDNWKTAELIARLLRDAVKNNELAVKEALVEGCDLHFGHEVAVSGRELHEHLYKNGYPNVIGAKFQGNEVWEWMAYHRFIEQKYVSDYPPRFNIAIQAMRAQQRVGEPTAPNEQVANLSAQVADLTERLQQAEAEIAALKVKTPAFRHMTPVLELVAEVQERYWGDTWDQADADTNSMQRDIIEWVRKDPRCPRNNDGEASKNQATMVAVVAKPNT